jgi:O-antigen/teichoic acid export membrane protein
MFISGLITFFWVTGIIQSLLTLYNRNTTYNKTGQNDSKKSPEIFNAFVLLCIFSIVFFGLGHLLKNQFSVFHIAENLPYINLLLFYILLSSPVCLIEYIYLLNNRAHRIFQYGYLTFGIQLVAIILPVLLGKEYIWSIWGLLGISIFRWVWLIIILRRYCELKISADFIKEHLYLAMPMILTALISGSAQYIDGIIISTRFGEGPTFATFRYGAKEFPLVIMLSTGLSSAMLSEFSTRAKMIESLEKLKDKSRRLMHLLFPASMVAMFFARWVFPRIFGEPYERAADIYMIYLLLVIPRLVFPQTIVLGRKKTGIALISATISQAINIPFSLALIPEYGIVGVAFSTLVVYMVEKVFLIIYLQTKMDIKPVEYIPVRLLTIYSILIGVLFILIDHRIINFI